MDDALPDAPDDGESADSGVSGPPETYEDDAFAAALATVLDRAEAGDGTVSWADVNDAVPAEQWGRLLGSGTLVATHGGFVVDDPDGVRAAVAARDDPVPDPGEVFGDVSDGADDADAGGWSTADRVAGVGALGLVASYQVPVARDAIGGSVHALLGPVEATLPFGLTIAVLAVLTSVVSTTLRSRLTDDRREAVSDRMEAVSEQLRRARDRGDDAAVERLQARRRELLGEQFGAMKRMVRPMVWTMLVTVPVFLWLTWLTVNPAAAVTPAAQVLPLAGRVVWTARIVGPMQVWMAWYLVCSVVSNVAGKRAVRRARPVVSEYRSVV